MVLCMSELLFYLVYSPHGPSEKTEHIFEFCRKPSFDVDVTWTVSIYSEAFDVAVMKHNTV